MSGDYSRVRFDPSLDLSGVLMQQGRVQLDSDWNEWVSMLERRLRAENIDTFGVVLKPGISGVAVVSPQTPDAFKIEAVSGNISIGRGRMYVDGLLAENHGGGSVEFDPVLAELRHSAALAYADQPYFPAPPVLPTSGTHLAYLEVWQRELTYLEHPELVEQAVGVDTTVRLQTVWQVRLLGNVNGATCTTPDDQVAGWQALIQPSAARVSIRAAGVPSPLDPCDLPPNGGYRGLENQLYRIEIHDGGALGVATFKWSRDNASVASAVSEIVDHTATATELKLASLGRDAVLRFNTGDWVEILDDRRELSGENGNPSLRRGVMRKITVDDSKQTISFSPALPTDLIPSGIANDTLAKRHTRVKRWDQSGTVRDSNNNVLVNLDAVGSSGLIPVPAAGVWVALENGVQVQFSLQPAIGGFHCGDYWVSAARTADASVEALDFVPPRGLHHHYARLSLVTFPSTATDCRNLWPPAWGGCCTYTVGDGIKSRGHYPSIQEAVNALPPEGGKVCVLPGTHYANVRLHALDNIHISGCGLQTVIFPTTGQPNDAIFNIEASTGIQISDLTLVAKTGTAIVVLDSDNARQASRGITISNNHIIASTHAISISCDDNRFFTSAIQISGNQIAQLNTDAGVAAVYVAADNVVIENNLITVVPESDEDNTDELASVHSLLALAKTARVAYLAQLNATYLAAGGIQIAGGSEFVSIRHNRIVGGSGNGVTLGSLPRRGQQKSALFISELDTDTKNFIDEQAIPFVYDITLEDNSISYMGLSGIAPPVFFKPGLVELMPSVSGLSIYRNRIEHCLRQLPDEEAEWTANATGFGGIVLMAGENVQIQENTIENNGSDQPKAVCGILIFYGEKIDISGNRILNNGARAVNEKALGIAGLRGGIVIVSALAPLAHGLYAGKEWLEPDGIPAIKIHHNIITQPLGQALFLIALGPVSVIGNHLTSQGADFKANPYALLAGTVFIVNLGIAKDLLLLAFLASFKTLPGFNVDSTHAATVQQQANEFTWLRYLYLPSGTVMFSDNQVLLDLRNPDINFSFSSQLIASLDDVAYCNNQSECSSLVDFLFTDAAIFAVTQRCNNNRFQEGFTLTLTSLFSYGFMNTAMGNQATHCLQVFGNSNFLTKIGNTVLLTFGCPDRESLIAGKYVAQTTKQ